MGRSGREAERERIYVYILLISFIAWQTLTQHYKTVVFQFKKIFFN